MQEKQQQNPVVNRMDSMDSLDSLDIMYWLYSLCSLDCLNCIDGIYSMDSLDSLDCLKEYVEYPRGIVNKLSPEGSPKATSWGAQPWRTVWASEGPPEGTIFNKFAFRLTQ